MIKNFRAFASTLVCTSLTACATLPEPRSSTQKALSPVAPDADVRSEIKVEFDTLDETDAPLVSPQEVAKIAAMFREDEDAENILAPTTKVAAPKQIKLMKPLSGGQARAAVPAPASKAHQSASLLAPATTRSIPSALSEGGSEPGHGVQETTPLMKLGTLETSGMQLSASHETPVIFELPVTYNRRVSSWIRYFQSEGRVSFRTWLERSARFFPILESELRKAGLPRDLVYVAMIESGFNPNAASHASAVGLWQFIAPTGQRYGLKMDWWLDERRDFEKSTRAAIGYMTDLYDQFRSWYLVAASYNMGENGVRRLIQKHGTNNFWELADKGALPRETTDYVPKILAAMLISKAPALYGFRDLNYHMPMTFESVTVPGGVDLTNLANYLGVSQKYLQDLNPELIKGFVPRDVRSRPIRVPKGSTLTVAQFVRLHTQGFGQEITQ